MPSPKSPKGAAVKTPAKSLVHTGRARAPFGFVFLFLLLAATFVFSTLFVVSQTAREQALRQEAALGYNVLEQRLDALQTQVNTLSARVATGSSVQPLTATTSTTSTLPTARTR